MGNIESGGFWSFCLLLHVRDSGVTDGGGGGISPGDAVGGDGSRVEVLDSRSGVEWPD